MRKIDEDELIGEKAHNPSCIRVPPLKEYSIKDLAETTVQQLEFLMRIPNLRRDIYRVLGKLLRERANLSDFLKHPLPNVPELQAHKDEEEANK
jgi:hypothetical protein